MPEEQLSNCSNCKHYYVGEAKKECRIRAPTVIGVGGGTNSKGVAMPIRAESFWPPVAPHEMCGEWQKK